MAEMIRGIRAKQAFNLINDFVSRFIMLSKEEQNRMWEILYREAELRMYINDPIPGTFFELMQKAKDKGLLYRALAKEDAECFPERTRKNRRSYFVRLFPFLPGEEVLAVRSMNDMGYRHGTGCELMHLVFTNKFHVKDVDIIARGTTTRPDKNEGNISPMVSIEKDGRLSMGIHDHKTYGSPAQLYFLGVYKKK